jgi:hypothetical protein
MRERLFLTNGMNVKMTNILVFFFGLILSCTNKNNNAVLGEIDLEIFTREYNIEKKIGLTQLEIADGWQEQKEKSENDKRVNKKLDRGRKGS